MPHKCPDVKRRYPRRLRPLLEWIDAHPRTGWYIVTLLALNTMLNLADLFQ